VTDCQQPRNLPRVSAERAASKARSPSVHSDNRTSSYRRTTPTPSAPNRPQFGGDSSATANIYPSDPRPPNITREESPVGRLAFLQRIENSSSDRSNFLIRFWKSRHLILHLRKSRPDGSARARRGYGRQESRKHWPVEANSVAFSKENSTVHGDATEDAEEQRLEASEGRAIATSKHQCSTTKGQPRILVVWSKASARSVR